MSLVERALKKLQESRATPPGVTPPGVTQVSAQPARAPAPPAAPAPARIPARVISVDRAALRAAELLPAETEERRLAQEYRQIKRPLIDTAMGRGTQGLTNGHVILVASALPGDGKTFTAINLALSMALEKDISVLLVDADVAKRHLARVFGVAEEQGLMDVLRDGNLDVESLILPTDVPGLSILPAGRSSDTNTELLASARMESVIRQLGAADANRIVVLDSPPLLLTTESRVLATLAGQVVLVVRANWTPQQAVLDAVQLIGEERTTGVVLNQSEDPMRRGYYQHYGEEDTGSTTA
jgi:protein-tyrosine kinase